MFGHFAVWSQAQWLEKRIWWCQTIQVLRFILGLTTLNWNELHASLFPSPRGQLASQALPPKWFLPPVLKMCGLRHYQIRSNMFSISYHFITYHIKIIWEVPKTLVSPSKRMVFILPFWPPVDHGGLGQTVAAGLKGLVQRGHLRLELAWKKSRRYIHIPSSGWS